MFRLFYWVVKSCNTQGQRGTEKAGGGGTLEMGKAFKFAKDTNANREVEAILVPSAILMGVCPSNGDT